MSPFSSVMHELRVSHDLRQFELAELLGYEQSYVSALEVGIKGPPPKKFVSLLIDNLKLDESWQTRLWDALELSQRKIVLPNETSESIYKLCNELRLQLDHLHPTQVELIRIALRLPRTMTKEVLPTKRRIRRRSGIKDREGQTM